MRSSLPSDASGVTASTQRIRSLLLKANTKSLQFCHGINSPVETVTNEHLYSPIQAARQTEDRLYTHGKEVHTTLKSQKCTLM